MQLKNRWFTLKIYNPSLVFIDGDTIREVLGNRWGHKKPDILVLNDSTETLENIVKNLWKEIKEKCL